MKNSVKALMLTAALTGMVGGTNAFAQPSSNGSSNTSTSVNAATPGVVLTGMNAAKDKHACKGKNDCKGKGGCKSSDNGCKGKNSCKGKGGCATDGSKPPANS
jgi:hypothetical protein